MPVKCSKRLLGKSIITYLYRHCELDHSVTCKSKERVDYKIFHCRIKPIGYEVPNIAEWKQTRQSYTDEGGIPSFANDEHISKTISNNSLTLCSYAREEDHNPWWRVDLEYEYIVVYIAIFNNEDHQGYLHDIEIRVGNYDIDEDYLDFRQGNPLCKNFRNETLPSGWNFMKCDHPLIGKYVSIEIAKRCDKDLKGCYPQSDTETNKLILCEVHVYGSRFGISGKSYEYMVPHHPSTMTNDDKNYLLKMGKLGIFSDEMENLNLNWWILTIKLGVIVVTKVKLVVDNAHSTEELEEIPLEILVGFPHIKIERSYFYGPFNTTTTWFAGKGNRTIVEEGQWKAITIHGKYHSIGRYITIIAPGDCKNGLCDSKQAMKIVEVEIGIQTIFKFSSESVKGTQFKWGSGELIVADLLEERKNLIAVFRKPICTHTSAMHTYPWWQAKFYREVIVENVTIWNTKDNSSELLRDIEIRVGTDEIRIFEDEALEKNQICYKGETLVKLKNALTCYQSLFGSYLTIQIVPKDPLLNPYNILTLCKVEVYGKQIRIDRMKVIPPTLTNNRSVVYSSQPESR
uniref:Fucolectin n=1 Tax=Hemiscolopendra marginata TaxID=943146 RepID=A0A646QD80_9MYRI